MDLKGKKALVTGGSGFLGKCLIKRLIESFGCSVVTVARDEGKLIELKQDYPDLKIITGDIADPFVVRQAVQGIDCVFHLAAFKHVGIAEDQTRECVKSNVLGSLYLLEQTVGLNLDFFLAVSTDKAAKVSGMYGATKLLMEGMTSQFERLNSKTRYRVVRYGNVLYSTGSVLCKWRQLLKDNKEIIITDPDATRFFWTIDQAVDLIFECLEKAEDASPWVPEMKSMRMGDLLSAMANKYLPPGGVLQIKKIGLQQGENKHEYILADGLSSEEAEKFAVEEIEKLI